MVSDHRCRLHLPESLIQCNVQTVSSIIKEKYNIYKYIQSYL